MDSTALMTMPEPQMLARVEMAKFPQALSLPDKKLLAQVAITYGFDPLMGEITVYQGRPFVSIDGRYRKAQETGKLDGVETRPANNQERTDWGIPIGDLFYRSEVYIKGSSRPFVGWGRVYEKETKGSGFLPVVANPQRMAEKRAEAQALRKAFHIPLPSAEDMGSPDETQNTVKIIDITPVEQSDTPEVKQATSPVVERPTASQEKQPAIWETFRTGSDLVTWLIGKGEGKGNFPADDVKRILGVKTPGEIKDIKAAYDKMVESRKPEKENGELPF